MARTAAPLLALFAAAGLLAAPRALASASRVAAGIDSPKQPLAWSSLSPSQQRVLAPVQDQWDQMHPARQQRLAEHADHWATLPPQRQQQIHERLTRWANMTPQQRQQLRENARAFHDLTPEQRARVRAAFERFRSLPPDERKALRERWHAMPPAQRMRWADGHPGQPLPARPPGRRGH